MKKNTNKKIQLANLSSTEELKENSRSLKHGIYSARELSQKQKEIKDKIMKIPYIKEQDEILIDNLTLNLTIKDMIVEYLKVNGLFKKWPANEIQPVLKVLWTCLKEIRLELASLGLTPLDRARLGLDIARSIDFAKAIQEIDKERDDN